MTIMRFSPVEADVLCSLRRVACGYFFSRDTWKAAQSLAERDVPMLTIEDRLFRKCVITDNGKIAASLIEKARAIE